MPDVTGHPFSSARLDAAVAAVEAWFSTLPGNVRRLTALEMRRYRAPRFAIGWRLPVMFPDGERALNVLLSDRFPRDQPRIALAEHPGTLMLPHVDHDGVLCLLPDVSGTNPFEPVLVVQNVLSSGATLVEEIFQGHRVEDFRQEFSSYWILACSGAQVPVQSLLTLAPPTRGVRVWRGAHRTVVADDDNSLRRWLANLLSDSKTERQTEPAVLLWLEEPLVPKEYPVSGVDVLALARRSGGEDLVVELLKEGTDEVVILLGAPTARGPCLASISLVLPPQQRWPHERPTSAVSNGFRPGRIPKPLLQARFLTSVTVTKTLADRVDPAWIHGRGFDGRVQRLRQASVAVLGCGSLGAAVAMLLARAGVGRLILIDPERLTWANVGRHVLGARSVDQHKVEALAEQIRRDFPHIREVLAIPERWEDVATETPATIDSCDVIISTMGDWAAEGALNEWHIGQGRGIPVVYGWTEPEAVAGHAVAVVADGGCFQCGVDVHGTPLLRVTEWSGSTLRSEPGCGGVFQPYGPIDVASVVSLVADMALDAILHRLTTSTHRVWVARPERLAEAGGRLRQEWIQAVGATRACGVVEERLWQTSPSCRECMHPSPTALAIPVSA